MMKKLLVTGSSRLIGLEVVRYFNQLGWKVIGIDNNMRADFFGPRGDTGWVQAQLEEECQQFEHIELDIRERSAVQQMMEKIRPDYICHTAAQPSHDLAASRPFDDFDVNAVGTLNLLEAARNYCAESPFVHLSTNKVYGDGPNFLNLKEEELRYDFADTEYYDGIKETSSIDQCKHSLFGASKVAGEVYNIGEGRDNSTSILEAFQRIEKISGNKMKYKYSEENRIGDHICYISNLSKIKSHFPNWKITKTLQDVFEEITESWEKRMVS